MSLCEHYRRLGKWTTEETGPWVCNQQQHKLQQMHNECTRLTSTHSSVESVRESWVWWHELPERRGLEQARSGHPEDCSLDSRQSDLYTTRMESNSVHCSNTTTHLVTCCRTWRHEWVELNAPPNTIQVISEVVVISYLQGVFGLRNDLYCVGWGV